MNITRIVNTADYQSIVKEEKASLKQKAGGVFFIVNSSWMYYLATQLQFWEWQINGLELSIPFLVLAITHFCGGAAFLFAKNRRGMTAIFIANILVLLLLLSYILMLLGAYFNDPCYIDPSSCDDELTDTPFYLKAIGLGVTLFALMTVMSWRLHRPSIPNEEQ